MRSLFVVAALFVVSLTGIADARSAPCDSGALRDIAETARVNIIDGVDGAGTLEAWRTVLDSGGAVGWPVTEYNVDARSTFLFAFDRSSLRVYRASAFGATTEAATEGCIADTVAPEAVIPWSNVREIEAGNWVLWFKLRQPVVITSDRGKTKKVDELKAYFYGAPNGDLTYHYNRDYVGHIPFWNIDVYEISNLRGIAVGPNDFQRRLQFVIARVVDPDGRIALTRKGRGAGW
jgi:hypothetical protein